jgi:hypothetical protein
MPIDFPNTPSVGDQFSAGPTTWEYNGSFWEILPAQAYERVAPTVERTAATYTIGLNDRSRMVLLNRNSPGTTQSLVIPLHANTPFAPGDMIHFTQLASGISTSVSRPTGVTAHSRGNAYRLVSQYSVATLLNRSENLWVLFGDIAV